MSKINELRAQRAKTWEQTKAFLDSHRSDKGVLSAEDTATYEKMEQEMSTSAVRSSARSVWTLSSAS